MKELFRDLVIHQAKVHRQLLETWKPGIPEEHFAGFVDALVHDGLWLSKFPVHHTPTYGVLRLDALDKARQAGGDPETLGPEAAVLRPLLDADLLRFVLGLTEQALGARVEIFFGGRAMNKPLWNYLAAWFERSAVLRARLGPTPGVLDTTYL